MSIDVNAIISFLTSPDIQQRLFWVKVAFLAVGAAFLAAIVYFILTTHYVRWLFMQDFWEFITFKPFGARKVTKVWRKIVNRLETGSEQEYKSAVVEADDLLDVSLNRMGYRGDDLAGRLDKLSFASLPNIADVYAVHNLRNSIVRDPDFHLTLEEARKALEVFEKAFSALRIST
jgi:hypothetical protein